MAALVLAQGREGKWGLGRLGPAPGGGKEQAARGGCLEVVSALEMRMRRAWRQVRER